MSDSLYDSLYVAQPRDLLRHAVVGTMLFLRQPRHDGAEWALVTGRDGARLIVSLLLRAEHEVGQPPLAAILPNYRIFPAEIATVNARNAAGTWDPVIDSLYQILSGGIPTRPFPAEPRKGRSR